MADLSVICYHGKTYLIMNTENHLECVGFLLGRALGHNKSAGVTNSEKEICTMSILSVEAGCLIETSPKT